MDWQSASGNLLQLWPDHFSQKLDCLRNFGTGPFEKPIHDTTSSQLLKTSQTLMIPPVGQRPAKSFMAHFLIAVCHFILVLLVHFDKCEMATFIVLNLTHNPCLALLLVAVNSPME